MSFSKAIIVTDKEWQKTLQVHWKNLREYWTSSEGEGDLYEASVDHFFHSGDVKKYLEEALQEGNRPSWYYVLMCSPSRNFDHLMDNIQFFWNWVWADRQSRIPTNPYNACEKYTPQEYFDQSVSMLGSFSSPVIDPIISAKLHRLAFGETYEPEHVFPIALGPDKWHPVEKPDAEEQFWHILTSLSDYLFDPKPILRSRQCLWLVDYWLSTIPLLDDMRMFDTNLKKHDASKDKKRRMSVKTKQFRVRTFLALLNGYQVISGRKGIRHNDLELEDYIRTRLASMEMPPEYHRLVEFIHKHQTKCLRKSE